MAGEVKALAAKPSHLGLVPGTHVCGRELTPTSADIMGTPPHAHPQLDIKHLKR